MEDINILTVKDLINLLKNFDPDLKFGVYTSDGLFTRSEPKAHGL